MSNEEELFADGLGPDGIFLRAADRRRFDFVLRAVRDEGASLALSSTNDEVLDHYGRLVIKKLRLIPDLQRPPPTTAIRSGVPGNKSIRTSPPTQMLMRFLPVAPNIR